MGSLNVAPMLEHAQRVGIENTSDLSYLASAIEVERNIKKNKESKNK